MTQVSATLVPESLRSGFLPRHFGKCGLLFEPLVFGTARRLLPEYKGGLWNFHELSNGGMFMSPDVSGTIRLSSAEMTGFSGDVSGEVAGIIVTLFALDAFVRLLSDRGLEDQSDDACDLYYALRDYGLSHERAVEIYSAID